MTGFNSKLFSNSDRDILSHQISDYLGSFNDIEGYEMEMTVDREAPITTYHVFVVIEYPN